MLAPAYDLLCTALPIDDATLALQHGLYEGVLAKPSFATDGIYTRQSFMVFAEKIGVQAAIAEKTIGEFMHTVPPALALINQNFLSNEAKEKYRDIIQDRHRRFGMK